jgi:hypothetical protein
LHFCSNCIVPILAVAAGTLVQAASTSGAACDPPAERGEIDLASLVIDNPKKTVVRHLADRQRHRHGLDGSERRRECAGDGRVTWRPDEDRSAQ